MEIDKVYTGDCVEGMKTLDAESVDMVLTSPPYDSLRKYDGFSWNFEKTAQEIYRVTKPGGVVVWVVADSVVNGSETGTSFKQALYFMGLGFDLYDTMIWEKPSPQAPTKNRYYDVFEYMFVFSKGKPKALNLIEDRENITSGTILVKESQSNKEKRKPIGKRIVKEYGRRFNVWNIGHANNHTEHPAVFPEKLAEGHILTWSDPGDVVLDPFIGSGTTGITCVKNGRHYIGFEISPKYAELAQERIDAEAAQMSLFYDY